MIRLIHIVGILACLFSNFSCQYKATTFHASGTIDSASCYTNPLLSIGGPAFGALFHNGMYYYIRGVDDKICLWALKDITEITHEPTKTIWPVNDSQSYSHIWDPQIHYINGNGMCILAWTTAIRTTASCMYWKMLPPTRWKENLY